MNKLIICICIGLLMGFNLHGQTTLQVSQSEAEMVAKFALRKLAKSTEKSETRIKTVVPVEGNGFTAMYEIVFYSGESVLIAGHKSSPPILGVSHTADGLSILQNPEAYSLGLLCMIDRMYNEQCLCFQQNREKDPIWDTAQLDFFYRSPKAARSIEPLIDTWWSQSSGIGYSSCDANYNKYMPNSNGDCTCGNNETTRYPTGCTVTAFGQVMNYWQFPILRINRTEQIDWCNMPKRIKKDSTNIIQNEAVAWLMKILGDELGVSYGEIDVFLEFIIDPFVSDKCFGYLDPEEALEKAISEFGYSRQAEMKSRTWNKKEWANIVRRELEQGRPVIYYAFEDAPWKGAHTFICDGYDSQTGLFHFNWGHKNTSPSWCSIDDIVEGTDMHWTRNECAIFDFMPAYLQSMCNMHLTLENYYALFYPNVPQSPRTMTTLTSASISSPAAWRTIPAGASAEYVAHEEVILEDGFEAEWGSEFEAWIEPCAKCGEGRGDGSATRTLTQREDSLASDSTEATYMAPGHSEFTIHNSEFKIGLFPNPTDGPLTMETDGEAEAVVVYDAKGLPVGGWRLVGRSGRSLQLDVAALRPGAYILSVRTAAGTSTARFVRR